LDTRLTPSDGAFGVTVLDISFWGPLRFAKRPPTIWWDRPLEPTGPRPTPREWVRGHSAHQHSSISAVSPTQKKNPPRPYSEEGLQKVKKLGDTYPVSSGPSPTSGQNAGRGRNRKSEVELPGGTFL
jgi:hypothetical protein